MSHTTALAPASEYIYRAYNYNSTDDHRQVSQLLQRCSLTPNLATWTVGQHGRLALTSSGGGRWSRNLPRAIPETYRER